MTAGDLATGARIGRYVIIERVGNGAMGVVYGAYDPELDRKIALKLLRPGHGVKETARARLLREAKAIARLSHPNVVAVHDVGVYEDQVFLAMEFVAGGTIKSWLAEAPRTWREILDVFIAAGRGLVAAHAAGLVHRDFKPDNVLLDKDGRPRVVDFGIAREAGSSHDGDGEPSPRRRADASPAETAAALKESSGNVAPLLTLTKTGALVGTPAYMAPEQFMGQRGDERSDQFSFCVALYEALYGQRPFEGGDVLSLSLNVTQEQFRPMPKDRGVPVWIRRAILRGMKAAPATRWASMVELLAALSDDPAVKLWRRMIAGGSIALLAAGLLVGWQVVQRRRVEADRAIALHVEEAQRGLVAAQAKALEARTSRKQAFIAFDAMDKEQGEAFWRKTRALVPAADLYFDKAERGFEAAFTLDPSRSELKTQLAEVRYEHLLFAEDFRLAGKVGVLAERLTAADSDGSKRKALTSPGSLVLRTTPAASQVTLERFERDAVTGRFEAKAVATDDSLRAARATSLAPGSYRLAIAGPGVAPVTFPFEIGRGQALVVELALPATASVPKGFVYVPPGEAWVGDADENLRTQFLSAVPIHRRSTGGFFIAQRETTYRDWIAFLDSLTASERSKLTPQVVVATRGAVRLAETSEGWQLTFQTASYRYTARSAEPLVYIGRKTRRQQNWLDFPVAGVSASDAQRYFEWLRTTGRVPNARLCTEIEWERAARGADDRLFPSGDELSADDANFDVTYGRVDSAYGPDAVGQHTASRSPFGIDDMAGNLFEFAASSQKPNEIVLRGGAYYFGAATCRVTNREPVTPNLRDVTTGIRVCAS